MTKINVGFKRLSDNAVIPTKAHATDSGFDLVASEDVVIEPGETAIVPTGIAVSLPEGYEAQVRPRSGVTAKTKLRVQLGTIDNSYIGDIGVIVDNICGYNEDSPDIAQTISDGYHWDYPATNGSYIIRKHDRIAQLVVQPLPDVEAYEIEGDIEHTARGAGGFGSSGVRDESKSPGIVVGYIFNVICPACSLSFVVSGNVPRDTICNNCNTQFNVKEYSVKTEGDE